MAMDGLPADLTVLTESDHVLTDPDVTGSRTDWAAGTADPSGAPSRASRRNGNYATIVADR